MWRAAMTAGCLIRVALGVIGRVLSRRWINSKRWMDGIRKMGLQRSNNANEYGVKISSHPV
jgi:hypothetical protein